MPSDSNVATARALVDGRLVPVPPVVLVPPSVLPLVLPEVVFCTVTVRATSVLRPLVSVARAVNVYLPFAMPVKFMVPLYGAVVFDATTLVPMNISTLATPSESEAVAA